MKYYIRIEMNYNKESIINTLKTHKSDIERFGVNVIGLFGSYVRNEGRENSDIDILIDFEKDKKTFDNFMNVCFFLDGLFSEKKVEVVSKGGLSKYIAPQILSEVEYV